MDRFSKFAAFVRGRGWRSVLVLAFLVCAGWTPLLRAQSPVPVAGQTVSGMLPDDPSITALPAGSVTPNSPQGSRPIFDPFKPRPKFGIAAGSGTGSLGLNGAAGGFGLSVPRPSSLGRFGTTPGMGGPQGSLVTFFPTDGFATAPAIGAYGTFGPAPGTLPTLNQLMRTNPHVPLGSSSANFRLSYQDRFGTIGSSTAPDFSHMLATGMFTSSDLGNGMFLSAGTGSGGHMAGAPAATLGNGTGAPKHSAPGVAIKLSF